MFKAIKDNKIIAINESGNFPCMEIGINIDNVVEDTEHTCEDYKHYDGEFTLHNIEKDNEEMKQARANAYAAEVDPITAHIQRLSDEEQTPEVIAEIAALVEERKDKVAEIKARYPYQIEKSNNSDSVLSEAPENKGQSENESKEVI